MQDGEALYKRLHIDRAAVEYRCPWSTVLLKPMVLRQVVTAFKYSSSSRPYKSRSISTSCLSDDEIRQGGGGSKQVKKIYRGGIKDKFLLDYKHITHKCTENRFN